MNQLVDSFDRAHDSLRVSVTDRCNLRCSYCMPEDGLEFAPREGVLGFDDLLWTVGLAQDMGVEAVRITGGEPLLRANLSQFVDMLDDELELRDISLTTNGLLLERHAADLAEAGLDRVNVSMDSMDTRRFEEITRIGGLESAVRGATTAAREGLKPLKINVLVLEDFNTDELERWLELTRRFDVTVRFMEMMPIGEAARGKHVGNFVDLTEVRRRLAAQFDLEPIEAEVGNGPARYWRAPDATGKVGFITPMSHPYCDSCSRLRLTSTGEVRPCLADDLEVDIEAAIRRRDRSAAEAGFEHAVRRKPYGHEWNDGETTDTGMSTLGG